MMILTSRVASVSVVMSLVEFKDRTNLFNTAMKGPEPERKATLESEWLPSLLPLSFLSTANSESHTMMGRGLAMGVLAD